MRGTVVSNAPLSAVTEWLGSVVLFCQQTDWPCVMVAVLGEKLFELVLLMLALEPLLPHELATLVELLQAAEANSAVAK